MDTEEGRVFRKMIRLNYISFTNDEQNFDKSLLTILRQPEIWSLFWLLFFDCAAVTLPPFFERTLLVALITHTYYPIFVHFTCPHCTSDSPLTVSQIFLCPTLTTLRNSHHIPQSHILALSENHAPVTEILTYLQSRFLYDRI